MANDDLQRFIDELRARVSIVDVVGAKVKLVKKGREYQGLCPFHNEKTPSFTVNEAKGFYHCFGCGAHGDILKFEMDANGLPFMDAIQKLAHQAGVSMPKFSKAGAEEAEERKSLYEIMEQACVFFEKNLYMPVGAEGLKYFKEKRGLSDEVIKKFRLGYAPNNNGLMAHLKSMGIDEKDLNELGLMSIPEDKTRRNHDFFRNRVMIPITNKQGKVIAFGGRVMEKIEPKYLNSPETPIFNKRRNLYNLDKARESGYKGKKLIISEGYMDVIALDRYGFDYAVAPLGTALTEEQILEAWKVCQEPILCLDGDAPGTKAAMRAVDRVLPILKAGYSLKFLFLPDNMDPDEYLEAYGKESFASLLTKTKPLIDILWKKYTDEVDVSTPERKALVEKTIIGEVNKINDTVVKNYYLQEIKSRIYQAFKPIFSKPQAPLNHGLRVEREPIQKGELGKDALVLRGRRSNPSYHERGGRSNKDYSRKAIEHGFSSPEDLKKNIENESDKSLRFIIASQFIYPELIDDYEEEIFIDDIKDEGLRRLQLVIADTYHEAETPLNGDELFDEVAKKEKEVLKGLWEVGMLKDRKPFINDLRKNIDRLLLENKIRAIDEELKVISSELMSNFSEDAYIRSQALKKERDEIIWSATDNPE
ncbi:MAG: DNA primase [Alphaproteobacteria bacterium]|nr:DNA primase [Alphaproteobacteria bacterium]